MLRYASRDEKHLPAKFYNLKADLPELPPPPLHPLTRQPINPSDLEAIFPRSFIAQEVSLEREIPIPEKVLEAYSVFRPTPLIQASKLQAYLETPARIFYKFEGVSPTGSHKTNTALMQTYLASQDGVSTLSTETGAGQWGTALAYAGSLFGVKARVYMVRSSFRQKPGRRIMMQLFGGEVTESPSPTTDSGLKYYQENPEHPGSLGIAISEAVEVAVKNPEIKYSLGSVLDTVLIHQSIIGLEAQSQCRELGIEPDLIIGCVGGGSNFAGLSFPFVRRNLKEKATTKYLAIEPEVCPSITGGELTYDYGDSVGLTPLLYMYTLGKDFIPPAIQAGGLRYHGMAPLVSQLVKQGLVQAKAYAQDKVFQAAELFLKTEGILPAPESAHAIAAVIDQALQAKKTGQPASILFNLSGHGFLDISAYDRQK